MLCRTGKPKDTTKNDTETVSFVVKQILLRNYFHQFLTNFAYYLSILWNYVQSPQQSFFGCFCEVIHAWRTGAWHWMCCYLLEKQLFIKKMICSIKVTRYNTQIYNVHKTSQNKSRLMGHQMKVMKGPRLKFQNCCVLCSWPVQTSWWAK